MTTLDREELRRRTQQIAQLSEDPTKSVDTTGAVRDAKDFGRAIAQTYVDEVRRRRHEPEIGEPLRKAAKLVAAKVKRCGGDVMSAVQYVRWIVAMVVEAEGRPPGLTALASDVNLARWERELAPARVDRGRAVSYLVSRGYEEEVAVSAYLAVRDAMAGDVNIDDYVASRFKDAAMDLMRVRGRIGFEPRRMRDT